MFSVGLGWLLFLFLREREMLLLARQIRDVVVMMVT